MQSIQSELMKNVERCVTSYSTGDIEALKAEYNPQESLRITVSPGPFLLDCNNLKLIFRPVYPAANFGGGEAFAAADPKDFFSCSDLTINGTSLLGRQEEEGRGRYCSFKDRIKHKSVVDSYHSAIQNNCVAPQTTVDGTNVQTVVTQGTYAAAGLFLDQFNLYNTLGAQSPLTNVTDVSVGPYFRNQSRAAQHRQKNYTFTAAADTKAISATALAGNDFALECIDLVDLIPELRSMPLLNMTNKTLRIVLALNQSKFVLTSGKSGQVAADDKIPTTVKYSITSPVLYQRRMQLKSSAVSMFSQMPSSHTMNTLIFESTSLSGGILNMKTNLTHNFIIGAVIFYQLANRGGVEVTETRVDYTAAKVVDNSLVHYYKDSYFIPVEDCFVEVGGVRYHSTSIPIENKHLASYINAQNAVSEMYDGGVYDVPLADFVTNKYATIIPINALATDGDKHSASGLVNLHCEFKTGGKLAEAAHYKATVVYIVEQKVLFDQQGNCRVEKEF